MTIETQIQDQWISCNNVCFRRDGLVFAVVLKNASTWGAAVLEHNGFTRSDVAQIDWAHDHVFGFIREPWARRIDGIAEDLVTGYSVEQYLLNNLGRKFWVDHLVFGIHSMPLSLTWHHRIYQIDWIPIDHPDMTAEAALQKLFDFHGLQYHAPPPGSIHTHKSDAYKSEIREKIKHMIGEGSANLQLMLAKDVDFYYAVMKHFAWHANHGWQQISWLQNYTDTMNKQHKV